MSTWEKDADPIIMVASSTATRAVEEAKKIAPIYKNRCSISRPLPHSKRKNWWIVYLDVYPPSDVSLIVEASRS